MQFPVLSQLAFWSTRRLPVLLQTESAECGLACMAMVASYWGYVTDVPSMRRRFSVSIKGVNLKGMMVLASALSLQSRPLKLDLEHLPELKLPCILHWDLSHFVVLKKVSAGHVVVHDPAVGERNMALADFSRHFTGVALELTPMSCFEPKEERQKFSLFSLMGNVVGLRRGMLQVLALGLGLQVCALIAPFYMQWIVDEALLSSDRDLITVLGCGFLLLVLLQTAIGSVRSWITTALSTSLNLQWLGNAFAHLLRLPLPYFEKRHTGDIVSRFNSIHQIQTSLTTQFVEGIIDGILVLGTLAMMLLYSPTLAAICFVTAILYGLLRWAMFRPLRDASSEQIIHTAKQQSNFMETVRGMQSVRLFGRSEERRSGWMNSLTDEFNAQLRIAKLSIAYQTLQALLFGGERVLVIWLAAIAVLRNEFSIGMMFAFISYKDQFSQRTTSLIDKLFELRMMRLHGERVADIVLTESESDNNTFETDISRLSPAIEIVNLSFRYSDGEPEVIRDLNLNIPAGQCVAFTGPSGCGKTTLIKLLLGLLTPTGGEIRVGGLAVKTLGLTNYREILGTVMQDDTLFAGSIKDNISFFDPIFNMQRVVDCADLASIAAEINAMPMAYNTLIGDIGTGLSGGQKQRILLARALYKNPKILVLDEATSHLDIWNEQAVNLAVKKIPLTRIIVAHRPETIQMAERLIVLQNGRIVEDVTHHEAQVA